MKSLCNDRANRDNHIFKKMAQLLEPGMSQEAAQKLAKEVVHRVGRGAVGDFAKALCNRIICRLLPTDYMQAILERLISEGTDDDSGQALMALVADSANANPYILAPLSHQASPESVLSSCGSEFYDWFHDLHQQGNTI